MISKTSLIPSYFSLEQRQKLKNIALQDDSIHSPSLKLFPSASVQGLFLSWALLLATEAVPTGQKTSIFCLTTTRAETSVQTLM